jgi:hypothetical protein
MSIELVEQVEPLAVAFLASIPYSTFRQECLTDYILSGEKKPVEKQIEYWYSQLAYFCKTVRDAKGIVKRFYHFSSKNPRGVCGRLFSYGSIQSIWGKYRGLLLRNTTTDIDMKNAHPVILRYICLKHGIPCPHLEYYINHRDECLSQFENKDIGKTAYLKATNSDKHVKGYGWDIPSQLKDYDKEMKVIQKKLIEIQDYKLLIDTVPIDKRGYNYNGSAINRILCYYENEILHHAIHIIRTENIEIAVLMFDGLLVYGDYYSNKELLEKITEYVESQMEGLQMKWAYKEHDVSLVIPEGFEDPKIIIQREIEQAEELVKDGTWESMRDSFEKIIAKIHNKSIFVKKTDNGDVFMTKANLIATHEHMVCKKLIYTEEGVNVIEENFIQKWIRNNPSQLGYEDIGCYSNPSKCPKNIYNTWIPFVMEKITDYSHHQEGLDFMLNHIHILCGRDKEVSDYMERWIGQMILYPEVKTTCPVFISEEGAGKGSLLKLFVKMLGQGRVFETADPSRDVWGSFNGRMASAFLVNLNELSKKDTIDSEGKMKALITDPRISINNKGVNQFEIPSYHRFIITTNKEEPVNTTKDDRRKLIVRCSDELCGNTEYFSKFNDFVESINVVKTCYEYFKALPDLDTFNQVQIPQTEYKKDMAQLSVSPIELWLKHFVSLPIVDDEVILNKKTSSLYELYKSWCETNANEISYIKFSVRLKRLGVKGLAFTHGRNGNYVTINKEIAKNSKRLSYID